MQERHSRAGHNYRKWSRGAKDNHGNGKSHVQVIGEH
jgi:hypothetical protein